ncbi:MAG: radical SAM protein, partial [Hungatella hathewayi]
MEYVPAKTIVTKAKDTSWFGIDYNMNIYRGCCHGCIYC